MIGCGRILFIWVGVEVCVSEFRKEEKSRKREKRVGKEKKEQEKRKKSKKRVRKEGKEVGLKA